MRGGCAYPPPTKLCREPKPCDLLRSRSIVPAIIAVSPLFGVRITPPPGYIVMHYTDDGSGQERYFRLPLLCVRLFLPRS